MDALSSAWTTELKSKLNSVAESPYMVKLRCLQASPLFKIKRGHIMQGKLLLCRCVRAEEAGKQGLPHGSSGRLRLCIVAFHALRSRRTWICKSGHCRATGGCIFGTNKGIQGASRPALPLVQNIWPILSTRGETYCYMTYSMEEVWQRQCLQCSVTTMSALQTRSFVAFASGSTQISGTLRTGLGCILRKVLVVASISMFCTPFHFRCFCCRAWGNLRAQESSDVMCEFVCAGFK